MAYSEEVKEKVKKRLANGEKVTEINKQTGISIATLYKWKKETKKEEKQEKSEDRKEDTNTFKESMKVEITNPIPKVEKVESKKRETDHFYGIIKYLEEKKCLIYANMQSNNYKVQTKGISQWDRMEELIEKVNENKDNKEYLDQLYAKISHLQDLEKGMDR